MTPSSVRGQSPATRRTAVALVPNTGSNCLRAPLSDDHPIVFQTGWIGIRPTLHMILCSWVNSLRTHGNRVEQPTADAGEVARPLPLVAGSGLLVVQPKGLLSPETAMTCCVTEGARASETDRRPGLETRSLSLNPIWICCATSPWWRQNSGWLRPSSTSSNASQHGH